MYDIAFSESCMSVRIVGCSLSLQCAIYHIKTHIFSACKYSFAKRSPKFRMDYIYCTQKSWTFTEGLINKHNIVERIQFQTLTDGDVKCMHINRHIHAHMSSEWKDVCTTSAEKHPKVIVILIGTFGDKKAQKHLYSIKLHEVFLSTS